MILLFVNIESIFSQDCQDGGYLSQSHLIPGGRLQGEGRCSSEKQFKSRVSV